MTARDHSQTVELLDLADFKGTYAVVGEHAGRSRWQKIRGLLSRAASLAAVVKGSPIAVAVSHGSRSMVLAARLLGVPVLTMFDYEFTETRIFNKFSTRVLVPDTIPDEVCDSIGLGKSWRRKYPGIKEEMYVRAFVANDGFLPHLLDGRDVSNGSIIVFRPPATTANYHDERSELMMVALLRRLLDDDGVFIIIVPRTPEQAAEIEALIAVVDPGADNYQILKTAVDGLNLAAAADVVISGGGTMNREAVLLGVPVYSIFAGRLGSLDAAMERDGLITFIRDTKDVDLIELKKRDRSTPMPKLTDRVEKFVIAEIDKFL